MKDSAGRSSTSAGRLLQTVRKMPIRHENNRITGGAWTEMKFYIRKHESPAEGIQRINLELRAAVIGLINEPSADVDTAVHEVRKCIKKLRAVLRLCRPAVKASLFRRTDRALRNFAREISGARDSAVMVKTFDCLTDHYRPFLDTGELTPVRQALQDRHVQAMAMIQERLHSKELEGIFIRLELRLNKVDNVPITHATLAAGVRDVYRRGRKLHQLLNQNPDTEFSHGLRRQAKYLWYQLRILANRLPEQGQALIKDLDELCELLGDDNDMAVLIDHLGSKPGICCNRVQAELLCSLAETRRISLLSAALRLSERIYARKPREFVGELFPAA